MHSWNDDWQHWEDLNKAIHMAHDLAESFGLPTYGMKEKYGSFRWYYCPETEFDKDAYRTVYERVVVAYPHLATELLADADCRELLVGIVNEKDCDHGSVWTTRIKGGKDVSECATCGKDMTDE